MTFSGLSEREAEASREKYGSNERFFKPSFGGALLRGVFGLSCKLAVIAVLCEIILILLGLLEITEPYSNYKKLFILLGTAVFCAVFEAVLQYRSDSLLCRICSSAAKGMYTVFRDGGKPYKIPENMLAVGDMVLLSKGDTIPADGIMADGLITVDQSVFGVLGKAEKAPPPSGFRGSGAFKLNSPYNLYCGSSVVGGSGIFRITAIGESTAIAGKNRLEPVKIYDEKFSGIIRAGGIIGSAAALAVMIIYAVNGVSGNIIASCMNGLSAAAFVLAVSCFCGRNLICVSRAAAVLSRLSKKYVNVSNPEILSDASETGIVFAGKSSLVTEDECSVSGFIDGNGNEFGNIEQLDEKLEKLFKTAVISTSEAQLAYGKDVIGGGKFERAVLRFAGIKSYDSDPIKKQTAVTAAGSYELSGATVSFGGKLLTFICGGAEIVLDRCSDSFGNDGKKQKITNKNALIKLAATISLTGKYVIAYAVSERGIKGGRLPESGCTLIGLTVLHEKFCDSAAESVKRLEKAGVKTILLTEASRETAIFSAKRTGINNGKGVILSSEQLAKMSDKELGNRLSDIRAIVRARPSDKKRMLNAAHGNGLKAFAVGTRENDIQAFEEADIVAASPAACGTVRAASDVSSGKCGLEVAADTISYSKKYEKACKAL
ncbi:MAG: hypothetical protein ACI4KG_10000, partial [Oscillospiraceae bacterium]